MPLDVYHPRIPMCWFAPFELREIFLTNQPALEWRGGLDWVSRYWSPLPNFVPTEHLTGELLRWHCFKRGLGGKKARVAFHCKSPLNLVFLHWMEFTLKVWNFKPLVLCHLLDCYIGLITLAVLWTALPHLANFHTKKSFSERRTHLEYVSSSWSQLQTCGAYRAFGLVTSKA